jgi:stage IV sporulation protein FB
MFSAEPQRTQYDLNFQLFGFPVRVHPFFWLAGLLLGASGSNLSSRDGMAQLLIWVAVLFVSILVHELGHAFAFRYYGSDARIVLYMMGGLAIPESSPYGNSYTTRARNPWNHIAISFAGPAAGFLLAGLVVAAVYAARARMTFHLHLGFIPIFGAAGIENVYLDHLVHSMLFVNIFWGMVNLLPIFPLDGGQISRELFVMYDPYNGSVRSLWLSVIVAAFVAVVGGFALGDFFIVVMFGSLAFTSWQLLQQISGRGGGFGGGGYGGGGRPW